MPCLRAACSLVFALAAAVAAGAAPEIEVFREGRPRLTIYLPARPAPEEREAAALLARVLGAAGGGSFTVATESDRAGPGIYVGNTSAAGRWLPALTARRTVPLDRDGFRLFAGDGRIFVQGVEPWGTRFAAAWWLDRYAGARWFLPGEAGEVVPRRARLAVPVGGLVREPAWVSRDLWGLGPGGAEWADRVGLRARWSFSHNLVNVFPATLAADHPEWFPLLRRERHVPAGPEDYHWQPNLALPEVVAHAAEFAAEHFARHPGEASVALGINDTVRYDQSEATRAIVEPLRWHRGWPDYSDLVFGFMNRVAESLGARGGDRRLGALAYSWAENTPRFRVHPRVLPYLTSDRSQYYDADYRADDFNLMARWRRSGAADLGIYDYSYGSRYLVPRLHHGALLDTLSTARGLGVRGYFAEINAHWGFDAFKAWATARLLWEGDLDRAALRREFLDGAYGPAGAAMGRFFERCEARWMAQPGPPYWLKYYDQEDQALLFPPAVVAELEAELAGAAAAADSTGARERVDLTRRAFAVTAAFVDFDARRRELQGAAFGEPWPAERLARAIARRDAARRALEEAFAAARAGAVPAMADMPLGPLVRNDPAPPAVWASLDRDPGAATALAAVAPDAVRAWRAFVAGAAPNLAANGSFEITDRRMEPEFLFPHSGELPAAWMAQAMPTERGRIAVVETGAAVGRRALRVEGAWDTQVFRWLPAQGGRLYFATGWLRGRSSPGNDSALLLSFLDARGRPVGEHRLQALPKGDTPGWRRLVLVAEAPRAAYWVGTGVSVTRQTGDDWCEADGLELRALPGG